MSRREIRLRAVNATTAACNPGPNADSPIVPRTRASPLGASRAPQPMGAMLDIHNRRWWQLGNLMAPGPMTRDLLSYR